MGPTESSPSGPLLFLGSRRPQCGIESARPFLSVTPLISLRRGVEPARNVYPYPHVRRHQFVDAASVDTLSAGVHTEFSLPGFPCTLLPDRSQHCGKGVVPMQLAQDVKTFSVACEDMLSSITGEPLTQEEAIVIGYCCEELLAKIQPFLPERH